MIALPAYKLKTVCSAWFLGLDKPSLMLVIGFVTELCEIRSLTVILNNRSRTIAGYVAMSLEGSVSSWLCVGLLKVKPGFEHEQVSQKNLSLGL